MTNTIATVIGPGVFIRGSIHSGQDVVLHGNLRGNLEIESCRLIIGPKGRAFGSASALEVDIQGSIEGDVDSTTKVSIRTGGRLVGDIRAASIVIENEAVFEGSVTIVRPEAAQIAGDAQ